MTPEQRHRAVQSQRAAPPPMRAAPPARHVPR
jgi:hypothetical protein